MIHPTAMIDSTAEIAADADIGPYAYVGPRCIIHSKVRLGIRAIVECDTEIGEGTRLFPNACVGGEPQDLGYKGERTRIKIGKNNVLREFVTVHRATTKEDGITEVGDGCYFMANSHVAHDCKIGNGVIMANSTALSGHVHIGDFAVISGLVGIHQFVHIGTMAMVSALSRVGKDAPAYCTIFNDDIVGLNTVGLRRRGVAPEVRAELKKAMGIFIDKSLLLADAKRKLETLVQYPEIITFRESIEGTKRGVIRKG